MENEMGTKEKKRILIVDDVETNRFTLRDIILDMGYQPILTENGEQALRIVQRFPLSLIISDIAMPVMDGYELCTRLKENPDTRDIPIIFISAFDDPSDIIKGFELKGEDYVTKPFIPEVVKVRVQMHLTLAETKQKMRDMNRMLQTSVDEQGKQVENEKKNVLYALLRVIRENPGYDQEEMNRLSYNCRMLAGALQLSNQYGDVISDSYIDMLELAAPLSNLGYVGISTDILKKLPDLSSEEQKEYQRHTKIGAEILGDIQKNSFQNDFLEMSENIARSHHENWDGSGYPDGKKENEIPLSAQIVALADAYGKMSAKQDTDGAADMWEQLDLQSGVKFNPDMYEVMKKIARQLH